MWRLLKRRRFPVSLDELVTYQKVWAVAHVNTIGTIGTVWHGRSPDGDSAVDVIPLFTPEACAGIRSFDSHVLPRP